jgi:hypothetical protein
MPDISLDKACFAFHSKTTAFANTFQEGHATHEPSGPDKKHGKIEIRIKKRYTILPDQSQGISHRKEKQHSHHTLL